MSGKLELQITYKAILDFARREDVIAYSDIALQHGREAFHVRSSIRKHLNELMKICRGRDWPAIPVIVVKKGETVLTKYRDTFIDQAKEVGYTVENDDEFVHTQMSKVFEWAKDAPDILEDYEPIPEPDEPNGGPPNGDKPGYWVVGAYHGDDNQKDRFLEEGIWENGDDGKSEEKVKEIKVGDRLIMKSTFTQRKKLPFENNGKTVSVMRIKATGTVTKSTMDGRKVEVEWRPLSRPRDWYFFVYRKRLVKMDTSKIESQKLIKFAFEDEDQDFDYWLSSDWIREKGYAVDSYGIDDIKNDGCFVRKKDLSDALFQLRSKKNLILQGPPGTGKTWLAKRLANALIGVNSDDTQCDQVRRIQFHPSLSYEDFVRGWRPKSGGKLDLVDGAFLKAVNAASLNLDSDHVIVIDEINRGNTAQIFGEMLTLIESDKRSENEAIEIAYPRHDGERIHVPDNLHIIGTMNIADRSLALVDLALRRRFAFMSLKPVLDERWVKWCVKKAGIDPKVVDRVGNAVRDLNEQITLDSSLGKQYRIGHSYVTPSADEVVEDGREWFRQAIVSGIDPLLHEIWFENPEKAKGHVNRLLESVK